MTAERKEPHDFQKSLKRGQKGEAEFFSLFSDVLERLDGYTVDFRIKKSGKTVELKTDLYDPSKSENFFMERFSYGDKPGGPWQSLDKGADYFVYFFPSSNLIYAWETKVLVAALDMMVKGSYLINVRNIAHTTRGYKVERAILEKYCIPITKIMGIK